MRLVFLFLISVCLVSQCVTCLPCVQSNSSVAELKGFNHSYEFPCMYSGVVDIDPAVDSSIFYWFFFSPKPDYATNLVLWFAGGPGGSGEGSIFGENGPLRWRSTSNGTIEIISDIKHSIVDVANVIYVDNPLGVGFSSSQEPITKGEQIGDYIVKFMIKFYEIYPQQRYQELIIAGNSYGGHFIPAAAKAIQEYNKASTKDQAIPLKSLFVEDGYVNPIVQRLSIKDLAFASGLLTPDLMPEYEALEQTCESATYNSPSTAFEKCKNMNNLMFATDGGWDLMDIRYASGKGAPRYEDIFDDYFNNETVQRQLHTLKNEQTIPYSGWNNTCYLNMRDDGVVDYTGTYNSLVNSGIKTMVISGALDGLDGIVGTEKWVRMLNITEDKRNSNLRRSVYYYLDSKNNQEQVGGTYTTFTSGDNNVLSLVHVYAGGHVLGITQLDVVKSLLLDLITFKEPYCHKVSGSCSISNKICGYMNNCNKNGMCIDNKCQCTYDVAFGADCSIVPENISPGTLNLHPREWRYLKVSKENSGMIIDINAKEGSQVHVYHKVGNAPARSDFDGLKKSSSMKYVIDKSDVHTVLAIHNPSTTYNVTVEIDHQTLSDKLVSV